MKVEDKGWFGYEISVDSQADSKLDSVQGFWSGESTPTKGVIDLSKYVGIRVNNVDYFFQNN